MFAIAAGIDEECEPCGRFYRDGLTVSFMKILTDEAVNSWKYNIHQCILNSCIKFLQLCSLHLKRDNSYLLDLLGVVLDPDNKFNTFNISRQPTSMTFVAIPSTVKLDNSLGHSSTGPAASPTLLTPIVAATTAATPATTAAATTTTTTTTTIVQPDGSPPATTQASADEQSPVVSSTGSPDNVTASPASTARKSNQWWKANDGDQSSSPPATGQPNSGAGGHVWLPKDEQMFAKSPPEPHHQRGWLVDLINKYVGAVFPVVSIERAFVHF